MVDKPVFTVVTYAATLELYRLLVKKADQIADRMFDLARAQELPNKYEDLCKCVLGHFTNDEIIYNNLMDQSTISLPAYLVSYQDKDLDEELKLILSESL